jgi:hypothetical protein
METHDNKQKAELAENQKNKKKKERLFFLNYNIMCDCAYINK